MQVYALEVIQINKIRSLARTYYALISEKIYIGVLYLNAKVNKNNNLKIYKQKKIHQLNMEYS